MSIKKRRDLEQETILKANRACAAGNLMLAKLDNWEKFFEPETEPLDSYPRKNIRAGYRNVKLNLSKEIDIFCKKNFQNMNLDTLERLYLHIKQNRGLAMPLTTFEKKFTKIKPEVLKGVPHHATILISLWGLQFKFPEDFLSKDIRQAIRILKQHHIKLHPYQSRETSFSELKNAKEEIGVAIRFSEYAIRSTILCCFNLLESFLNGLAWEFCQNPENLLNLSSKQSKLIQDTNQVSLKDKVFKYPKIISQQEISENEKQWIFEWIDYFKPYRDSLVHPSPFQAPEKFGGYDKLQKLYSMDLELALEAAIITKEICKTIYLHIHGKTSSLPSWLIEFDAEMDKIAVS